MKGARMTRLKVLLISSLCVFGAASAVTEEWSAIVSPDNSVEFGFVKASTPAFNLGLAGWGPKWAWVGVNSREKAVGDRLTATVPFVVNKAAGQVINIKFQAWKSAAGELTFRYDLSADKDVPVTMVMANLGVAPAMARGKLLLSAADGKESSVAMPFGRGMNESITRAVLAFENADGIAMDFDPACNIAFDGGMRIMLASEMFKAGSRSVTLKLTFPKEVEFVVNDADLSRLSKSVSTPDWFAFTPSNSFDPSVIGMEKWLDAPAGKHGGVRMAGSDFQFQDKTPVKFWGVNLSYGGGCAPDKQAAEFAAARYAKYGINAVRLHKFSYPKNKMGIGELDDAALMSAEGMDRLDYFSSQLKQRGIYFGWSHTFKFQVCPGNRDKLLAYDEIEKNLKGDTYALINFAEDIQDLMIEMVVNLLKHKNPYTGLVYADEPALNFIELQNEDDIFFYTSESAFNSCPTYKRKFIERFSDWLKTRYRTEEALKTAWADSLKGGESLAGRNIVPQTNPWFFGDDHLPAQQGGYRRRLLDTAEFLHEVQNKFYSRFVKAIRAAGYKGPLCGSPWQAPAMLPHYYNLRSDYLVGYIDRHNYFGGKLMDSMMGKPGSGYFSTGLQQVTDRPFGLSEWITVYPSLYSAEGPAMIAVYGMGLQGWDASYEFQSQSAPRMFSDRVGWPPWGVWEADVPTQVGQFPALARMIYRGDVKEAEVISTRRVSLSEMADGKFNFSDKVAQQGDVKTFGGSVPPEALAAGRIVVEFTENAQSSSFPDMAKYCTGTVISSTTKQLNWDSEGQGYFTVNTPGTKAVVGFAGGKSFDLGGVSISVDSPYASVFLTALEKNASLSTSKQALLCAVARNCNTDFKYFAIDMRTLDNGKAPILLEPVKATIRIADRKVGSVNVLDHDGRRTDKKLPVKNGQFTIDGVKDKALYYEVVFE